MMSKELQSQQNNISVIQEYSRDTKGAYMM